jgi:hypothetical protein
MGSCDDAPGAGGIGAGESGALGGGAVGGLCAKATELTANPRVVMRREDGIFIGDTSARSNAGAVPFFETAKVLRLPHVFRFGSVGNAFGPTAIRSACVRIADRTQWYLHSEEHLISVELVNMRHVPRWQPSC